MPAKIVITLNGGLVDQVLSTEPVEVVVIDYDTEGADDNELTEVPQTEPIGPETEKVFARLMDGTVRPEKVEQIFSALS